MNRLINRERVVHGVGWNAVHEGYFSDPAVAAPLVRKVQEVAGASRPETMVDLGGGTGFLFALLRAQGMAAGVSLVNLDDSPTQIEAARSAGIASFRGSVGSFTRRAIGAENGRCLFLMRSVLHYFGKDGLLPVLRHLRSQARPGDFFVHQTASFRRQSDAACLNEVYRMMRTDKWYPTVAFLRRTLREAGWRVVEVCPARPLALKDGDLSQRYQLRQADVQQIRDRLLRRPRPPPSVATTSADGFCAYLHYWTYVCTPAPEQRKESCSRIPAGLLHQQ